CFQRIFGASFEGATICLELPSRRGPSHCGQSAAEMEAVIDNTMKKVMVDFMIFPVGDPFSASAAHALNGSLMKGLRSCRHGVFGMIQKMVQGRVVPRNAVLFSQDLQFPQVLLDDLPAGVLVVGIAEVGAATQRAWFTSSAQLVLLER